MTEHTDSAQNPHLVDAYYQAVQHAVSAQVHASDRAAANGGEYRVSRVFDLTTTEESAYFYVDNHMQNMFFLENDQVKVSGGNAMTYVWDEPSVDTGTFQSLEFINTRSDVEPGPDQDIYFGYASDVTISDTGRQYHEDYIKASSGSPGQTSTGTGEHGGVDYIIGSDSSAMLEVQNDSDNTLQVSVSAQFHEPQDLPNLIQS